MKKLHVNQEQFYLSNNAYLNYQKSTGRISDNLDRHFRILSKIQKKMKNKFKNFKGLYISSTYRQPNRQKWSPHQEGRGLDISRLVNKNDIVYYLIDSQIRDEWHFLFELVNIEFRHNNYNQILCPYGILDLRKLSKETIDKFTKSHQDHFHLNIPKQ